MDESSRATLRTRLAALLSQHDELINQALVLRGRMLELENILTTLAGSDKNTASGE